MYFGSCKTFKLVLRNSLIRKQEQQDTDMAKQ